MEKSMDLSPPHKTNILCLYPVSSTQPTLGDTELNERHKSPAAANDVPGEGKALEAEDDHESENEDDGGTAAHDGKFVTPSNLFDWSLIKFWSMPNIQRLRD